jgi:transcriptional antiterminator RfaH
VSEIPARWYVVHTKPHQEYHVLDRLRFRLPGIEVFCPQIEVAHRRARRRVVALEPLFPSYLFIRMADEWPGWCMVIWTPGVRAVLGAGERPLPVPDDVIWSIQERVARLGFIRVRSPFAPGTPIRILDGPLAGLGGLFQRPVSRDGRVRVLLDILNRSVPIEIDALALERA